LLVGCAIDAVTFLPARLLLAAGKSKTVASLYALEVVPFVALAVFMAHRYGAIGVAWSWTGRALVNAGLLFSRATPLANLLRSPLSGRHLVFAASLAPLLMVCGLTGWYGAEIVVRLAG